MSAINVQGLTMVYKDPVRKEGLQAAFTSLFNRTYREIRAVQGISFEVTAGEVVVRVINLNGRWSLLSARRQPPMQPLPLFAHSPVRVGRHVSACLL
jgi:hypothetical protein